MAARTELENAAGLIPVPDPSVRSLEHLYREVDHIRRELDSLNDLSKEARAGIREMVETKFSGHEKAVALLQDFANRSPTTAEVSLKVDSLDALVDEKFDGIATQFSLRDTAIGTALQSAKEAVGEQNKSAGEKIAEMKAAFTKQIDQMAELNRTETRATNDKIDDMKGQLNKLESRTDGRSEGFGTIGAIALGFIALGVLIVSVMAYIK